MLQYLVVLLDDTSISYCHYPNNKTQNRLINLDDLKQGIIFAMKENLRIQFVYPEYKIPNEYQELIKTIDHSKIVPSNYNGTADVFVFNDWEELTNISCTNKEATYILQTDKASLFEHYPKLDKILKEITRLNIVLTNVSTFNENDLEIYKETLAFISDIIGNLYKQGLSPQLNLITDRLVLESMNNCNAGNENITLAPNGKFYICPAFYLDNENDSIGDLKNGLNIKNKQLYNIDYAPICRKCDAFHCKRCIYLNKKMTLEVNTPSYEQCVIAHLERNESKRLLKNMRKEGNFLPNKLIKEISYLDPYDIVKRF